jgi:hypothetical protein
MRLRLYPFLSLLVCFIVDANFNSFRCNIVFIIDMRFFLFGSPDKLINLIFDVNIEIVVVR